MFKRISAVFLFLFTACAVRAQTLTATATSKVSPGSYLMAANVQEGGSYQVLLNPSLVRFDKTGMSLQEFAGYGVSADKGTFAVLSTKGGKQEVMTIEDPGKQLNATGLSFDVTDPSLKVYVLNNGRTIVRSNIAHFDVYGVNGTLKAAVNNASGSPKGETISKLSTDEHNRTILVYNPQINRQGYVESRIQRLDISSGQLRMIYDRKDGKINHLRISDDGNFVAVVSGHKVRVIDVFGNPIRSLDFKDQIDGSKISENDRYITCWYSDRILVYDILSGRRVGSTTLEGPSILYADYVPEDHLIVGVAGDVDSKTNAVQHVQIEGIDLRRRKIAQGSVSGTLFWYPSLFALHVHRESTGHYRLTGFSEPLSIKTSF